MTTRLVVASTAFGLATVCAAYEAGLLEVDGPQVLVVVTNTPDPGATVPLTEVGGVRGLPERFDAVHDLNAAVAPRHPRRWRPGAGDLAAWERRLRNLWGLGDDDVTLLTESVAGEPAGSLARVFAEAPLEVYAEGLMSYGPTGGAVPTQVGERVRRVLHLDLVPGLVPVLHREWGAPCVVVPAAALRSVVGAGLDEVPPPGPAAVVLGQYLAADGLLDASAELDLYAALVRRCLAAGHEHVVFKQHPSAPAGQGEALAARVDAVPARRFSVATRPELVETWFAHGRVEVAVGCFSTALLTAATAYGIPVGRLGTADVLARMGPGLDLNRVPALLADAVVPDLATTTAGAVRVPADLQERVDAVAYAMRPDLVPAPPLVSAPERRP